SGMVITSWHAFDFNNKSGGRWIITGAACFVLSDSLLAFNKFYAPFEFAGIAIMLTYGIAQLFIAAGITKFMHSADKP
ncbi:lysoplasmalogenase family protein, partial [Rhizobium leguminosarum]|uniref:lysoplasmalogenase family protein n=1 Tax=Rhizobium leguminosarum TaxID=384 RepID=UPI003F9C052C